MQGQAIPDDPARAGEKMNAVFRVCRYPLDFAAFTGKTLMPGSTVENYPTSVGEETSRQPVDFTLLQNHPNPFNPETVIIYRIAAAGKVVLRIHDILGHETAVLVDEFKEPGTYQIRFNAADAGLSSGLYFYTLRAGQKVQTKKMILTK